MNESRCVFDLIVVDLIYSIKAKCIVLVRAVDWLRVTLYSRS